MPDEAAISLIRSCVFWATSPPDGNLFVSHSAIAECRGQTRCSPPGLDSGVVEPGASRFELCTKLRGQHSARCVIGNTLGVPTIVVTRMERIPAAILFRTNPASADSAARIIPANTSVVASVELLFICFHNHRSCCFLQDSCILFQSCGAMAADWNCLFFLSATSASFCASATCCWAAAALA